MAEINSTRRSLLRSSSRLCEALAELDGQGHGGSSGDRWWIEPNKQLQGPCQIPSGGLEVIKQPIHSNWLSSITPIRSLNLMMDGRNSGIPASNRDWEALLKHYMTFWETLSTLSQRMVHSKRWTLLGKVFSMTLDHSALSIWSSRPHGKLKGPKTVVDSPKKDQIQNISKSISS